MDASVSKSEISKVSHRITAMVSVLHSASRTCESLGTEGWRRQLELTIAWNRVDIAETEIFTEESQWKVSLPCMQHHIKSFKISMK